MDSAAHDGAPEPNARFRRFDGDVRVPTILVLVLVVLAAGLVGGCGVRDPRTNAFLMGFEHVYPGDAKDEVTREVGTSDMSFTPSTAGEEFPLPGYRTEPWPLKHEVWVYVHREKVAAYVYFDAEGRVEETLFAWRQ